jgi:hypothetical protein
MIPKPEFGCMKSLFCLLNKTGIDQQRGLAAYGRRFTQPAMTLQALQTHSG